MFAGSRGCSFRPCATPDLRYTGGPCTAPDPAPRPRRDTTRMTEPKDPASDDASTPEPEPVEADASEPTETEAEAEATEAEPVTRAESGSAEDEAAEADAESVEPEPSPRPSSMRSRRSRARTPPAALMPTPIRPSYRPRWSLRSHQPAGTAGRPRVGRQQPQRPRRCRSARSGSTIGCRRSSYSSRSRRLP